MLIKLKGNLVQTRVLAGIVGVYFCAAVEAAGSNEQSLVKHLRSVFPDVEVTRISPSPVAGLYEVLMGTEVVYITHDGRYVLRGDLLDLDKRRNLSEAKRAKARMLLLSQIPLSEVIEFAPQSPEQIVYVFTDTDCAFCRRLHRDVPVLNEKGIAIRYLAFPRAGIGSDTYRQMEQVWCASDRRRAMTEAKSGRRMEGKVCAHNPVKKQYQLGQAMGVRGTPAMFLKNGRALSGYLPPDKLVQAVHEKQR